MSPRGGEAARPKEYRQEAESTRADSHAEQESSNMASKRMKKMAVVQTDMPNDIIASKKMGRPPYPPPPMSGYLCTSKALLGGRNFCKALKSMYSGGSYIK